ncbi:BTAD domain-containing putative transcriptional regulator [Streptomyces sp. NPDC096176]|uniref:BTAD domain-containing putative transcriptional regulator n=1 Tax=Streptomyces sp. NPDC096176 TaxID=3366079 RepID=UPI003808DCE6
MQFGVLGAVEARIDGRHVDLGHARQRCVLAALLVDGQRPVTVDQLIDRVWGERPPQRARQTLHSYISRLRQALAETGGGATITRRSGGYVLIVEPQRVDLHHFRELVTHARTDDDDERVKALLDQALGLWRGEPFTGLDTPWINALRDTLEQERLGAQLDRNDVGLRLGHHADLLPCLSARAKEHPLDERLAGQLMLALYRCGRATQALEHYEQVRRRLNRELGTDPAVALRRVHQQILTADSALAPPVPEPAPTADGLLLHGRPADTKDIRRPAGPAAAFGDNAGPSEATPAAPATPVAAVPTGSPPPRSPRVPPRPRRAGFVLPALFLLSLAATGTQLLSADRPDTLRALEPRTGTPAVVTMPPGPLQIRPLPGEDRDLCLTEGRERTGRYSAAVAVQRPCSTAVPPTTSLKPVGDGRFYIMWNHPQFGPGCLTVVAQELVKGMLEPWTDCRESRPFQHFRLERVGPSRAGTYRIRPADTDQCVGLAGNASAVGAEAKVEPCTDAPDQRFRIMSS